MNLFYDLIDERGFPLINDTKLGHHIKRIETRFLSLIADESIIPISPGFDSQFHKVYFDKESSAKMTGDSTKNLMILLPYLIRDLIGPEVSSPRHYL